MTDEHIKRLTENDLADLIICEPITDKGIEALVNLGLTKTKIDEAFFFNNLYVAPKYQESAKYTAKPINMNYTESFEYPYSVANERFNDLREKHMDFCKKFVSDSQNQSPLFIFGVAGNGKSIEVNLKIRNPKRNGISIPCDNIVLNLERVYTELIYGYKYVIPEKDNVLWLFFMCLLKNTYLLVIKNAIIVNKISENFYKYFVANNAVDDKEIALFDRISKFKNDDSDKILFKLMTEFVDKHDAKKSIGTFIKLIMMIMYCAAPEKKHYLVFDNIEQYMRLNEKNIQIPNNALSSIYECVRDATGNVTDIYDRIAHGTSWRAFKIVLVLRRITGIMLDNTFAHNPTKMFENGNDYTGYFEIHDIWKNKKDHIWEKILDKEYNDKQHSKDVIYILDDLMCDNSKVVGTSYQELIAPLVNYGIGRNARAQAYATMKVYNFVNDKSDLYINMKMMKQLLEENHPENRTRYIYRRALVELQLKRGIVSGNAQRWENLFFGVPGNPVLSNEKDGSGKKITIRKVKLPNSRDVTLVRRVLSYLSNCPETGELNFVEKKSVDTEMYAIESLYNLIEGLFVKPTCNERPTLENTKHFLPLAKVLIALGNMSHGATKASSLIVLGVNDERCHVGNAEEGLVEILQEIWEAGKENSIGSKKYNRKDYGVRITDSGRAFLMDWQPSFSFFAALYCSEEIPLFFLRDIVRIKKVITAVYNAADELYKKYENEAMSFCGTDISLKCKKYLPQKGESYFTFKERVRQLHIEHLKLYTEFIEKNSNILNISTTDKESLVKLISDYIEKYKHWKTGKDAPVCF